MVTKRNYRKKGGLKKVIKNVLYNQLETHRYLHTLNNTITTTVDTSEMTDISQGDAENNRTGNHVVVRSLGGKFSVSKHASATASVLRVVLYTPRDADQLLTTLTTTGRIDSDDFKVWSDKLITVHTYKPVATFKLGHKWYNRMLKGMNVRWRSSTAGDVSENPVCIAMVSDEATNGPLVEGDVALYFKDP